MQDIMFKSMRALYSLYCVSTFVLLFFLIFPFFLLFSLMGRTGEKGIWYLVRIWAVIWFTLIGQRTQLIDWKEDYKKNMPYIVISNHQSYLDTAMIFRGIPFWSSPLAKRELVKIPLFGMMYKKMAILVDRSDSESKKDSYESLYEVIEKEKRSIFIFPEGTFSEEGKGFLPFYNGAFRIAIESQRPLLPTLLLDTRDRFNDQKFWQWTPGKTRVLFLEPIWPPKDIAELEVFKEEVRSQMQQAYINYKK